MYKLLLALFISGHLVAEIDQVSITWNTASCTRDCVGMIQRGLDKFPGVADFAIDDQKGKALIRWKPNVSFDLIGIKRLYQSIGIGFGRGDFTIKVHGVVSSDSKGYVLTSLGDNTKFRLIGGTNANPTAFQSSGSWQSFPLTTAQKSQLSQARSDDLVTDISGTIYFNNYDLPMIQVQNIGFPNLLPTEKVK